MKTKVNRTLNVLFEIMFWVCVVAAPYGVRCFLYDEADFLPHWLINIIVWVFVFIVVLQIFARQYADESEKENEKLRQRNKDLEHRLNDLQFRYDKIISQQIQATYGPLYQKQDQQQE